jgi:undecaprenyl-diphosphatase
VIELLHGLDKELFLALNGLNHPALNPLMTLLSGQIIWVPFIAFFFFQAWSQLERKKFYLFVLFLILVIVVSDVSSSYLTKNMVQRLRPCRMEDLKPLIAQFGQRCGGKYGFVSSHAANSLAIVLMSIRILSRHPYRYLFLLAPLLVSYSRIYLGAHFPGDILGGFFIGALWALVFSALFKQTTKAPVEI